MPYYASQGSAWINIGLTPITENCYNCSRQKQIPIFKDFNGATVLICTHFHTGQLDGVEDAHLRLPAVKRSSSLLVKAFNIIMEYVILRKKSYCSFKETNPKGSI